MCLNLHFQTNETHKSYGAKLLREQTCLGLGLGLGSGLGSGSGLGGEHEIGTVQSATLGDVAPHVAVVVPVGVVHGS